MKKVLFAVMAMIAIGFTSCGNKTQSQTEGTDTEVTINAEEEAAATINALTEQIEAKDASKPPGGDRIREGEGGIIYHQRP